MLPNRFPDEGQAPEYNTVDATLWYFEAVRAYHEATLRCAQGRPADDALLRDLFPVLQDIVDWHVRGTRYQIHVDPADGLLYAGEPGLADRIEINPAVVLGKPVIRGTRIPAELILRKLGEGATEADLLGAYPRLTSADIRAALTYAAMSLAHETIELQPA